MGRGGGAGGPLVPFGTRATRVWGGGGSCSRALRPSGAQGGFRVGPDPARSQVSHSLAGRTLTGAGLSALLTLLEAGRMWRGGSGARPALWLFFLPPSLEFRSGWRPGVGLVRAALVPLIISRALAWGCWRGGMTLQCHPHQEMWSKPSFSSSSSGSAWGSAVSLQQQHREPVSCTGGAGELSVCQDQERAGLCGRTGLGAGGW